jgi:exonuclease VII large subunit
VLRAELRTARTDVVEGLRGRIRRDAERVGTVHGQLGSAMRRILDERGSRLAVSGGRLDALSPLGALARGFAVPLGDSGAVLRSASEFRPGDRFALRLVDGKVTATTIEVAPAAPEAPAPEEAPI